MKEAEGVISISTKEEAVESSFFLLFYFFLFFYIYFHKLIPQLIDYSKSLRPELFPLKSSCLNVPLFYKNI